MIFNQILINIKPNKFGRTAKVSPNSVYANLSTESFYRKTVLKGFFGKVCQGIQEEK